jgi:hypothetical protein
MKKVEAILAPKEEISKIQHLDIKPQIELMGEEIRIVEQNINIVHWFLCRLGLQHCAMGNKCLKGYKILSFHLYHFTKISRMKSKV